MTPGRHAHVRHTSHVCQRAMKPSCKRSRFAKPAPRGSLSTPASQISMPSVAQKFIASTVWLNALETTSDVGGHKFILNQRSNHIKNPEGTKRNSNTPLKKLVWGASSKCFLDFAVRPPRARHRVPHMRGPLPLAAPGAGGGPRLLRPLPVSGRSSEIE